MKKILLAVNALLIGVIFFQACTNSKQNEIRSEEGGNDSVAILQKVKAMEMREGVYFEVRDFNAGIIDDSIAKLMSENYSKDYSKSKIKGLRSPFGNMDDTRSIRFSLETLKRFIENIERSTSCNTCNLATGITFYYGIYPGEDVIERSPSLKSLDKKIVANKHTLFMVPSYYDSTSGWVDFNYNQVEDTCRPTPYSVLMKRPQTGAKITSSIMAFDKNKLIAPKLRNTAWMTTANDALQNHGGMAPPPAASGTFPSPVPEGAN